MKESRYELERKLAYLETLVDMHHIMKFDETIHCLELTINKSLRALATEFQAMEHDPTNEKSIAELITFLEGTIAELKQFLHDG